MLSYLRELQRRFQLAVLLVRLTRQERKQLWPVFEGCRALAESASMLAGRQGAGRLGRPFSRRISVPITSVHSAASVPL
jgi:hypothetical protein